MLLLIISCVPSLVVINQGDTPWNPFNHVMKHCFHDSIPI